MATKIEFKAGSGAAAAGEIALPEGTGKAPGLVLIQEYWGVNDHIRTLVDRFAAAGFITLAPDLYHGKVTTDAGEAAQIMTALDGKQAMGDIAGAVAFLRAHPRFGGKVGITGFCMGGAYTFAATSALPDLDAAVAFYGIPPMERLDYSRMKTPILAHFATRDQWASVARAEEIKKGVESHGGSMRLEIYEADHAFMRDSDPKVFAPEAAKLGWERTLAFLHQHLG